MRPIYHGPQKQDNPEFPFVVFAMFKTKEEAREWRRLADIDAAVEEELKDYDR